ncbi:MAG: hypothetical protein ACNI26_13195 [Terasakiella sp.]|uniref:hypothetical protein n=1 Tax=unclassified Terasakiella TaxID=2614952 RepID=UPI003B00EBBC
MKNLFKRCCEGSGGQKASTLVPVALGVMLSGAFFYIALLSDRISDLEYEMGYAGEAQIEELRLSLGALEQRVSENEYLEDRIITLEGEANGLQGKVDHLELQIPQLYGLQSDVDDIRIELDSIRLKVGY